MNTNTTHTVSLHTDNSRANNANERLVVISWKTPRDEAANPLYRKPPALCISIPRITISVTPSLLAEPLQEAFNDLQNSMLRSILSEKPVAQRVGTAFTEEDLGAAAVASWLSGASTSGRLSKEKIEQWFNSALSDPLTLTLANKMAISDNPTAEEAAKLEMAISQRRLALTKIAGPGVPFNASVNDQLIRTVELADDSITKRQVLAKLNTYKTAIVELDDFI